MRISSLLLLLITFFAGCSFRVPTPPPPTKHLSDSHTIVGSSPTWGNNDAPVTVVVFSDFLCSHCSDAAKNLRIIREEFSNKVRVVFKHSPNSPHSIPLAKAAIAAGLQGQFWEMHDLLFDKLLSGTEERIERSARKLHLDLPRFARERRSRAVARILLEDLRLGNRLGIQSTPTFVVQNEVYLGALTLPELRAIVLHSLATNSTEIVVKASGGR